jgi:hypothetical protein
MLTVAPTVLARRPIVYMVPFIPHITDAQFTRMHATPQPSYWAHLHHTPAYLSTTMFPPLSSSTRTAARQGPPQDTQAAQQTRSSRLHDLTLGGTPHTASDTPVRYATLRASYQVLPCIYNVVSIPHSLPLSLSHTTAVCHLYATHVHCYTRPPSYRVFSPIYVDTALFPPYIYGPYSTHCPDHYHTPAIYTPPSYPDHPTTHSHSGDICIPHTHTPPSLTFGLAFTGITTVHLTTVLRRLCTIRPTPPTTAHAPLPRPTPHKEAYTHDDCHASMPRDLSLLRQRRHSSHPQSRPHPQLHLPHLSTISGVTKNPYIHTCFFARPLHHDALDIYYGIIPHLPCA